MVIIPLNHMFWRSIVEAILIDRHMFFLWRTSGIYAKVVHVMRVCVYDIDWGYSLEPPQ